MDAYDEVTRDYSTGVPRFEVGRITQLTESHKSKALETMSDARRQPQDAVDPSKTHSAFATQVGGEHYKTMAIQPTEYILANGLGFLEGNVVKYISRYKMKHGIQDLKKARHYIDMLIESEEKKLG